MSTHAEILDTHRADSQFKLRPHLLPGETRGNRPLIPNHPLSVTLEELLTPETVEKLRDMRLL